MRTAFRAARVVLSVAWVAVLAAANDLAELLTSICLGFVAQRTLAGRADGQPHVGALQVLTHRLEAPCVK